MIFQTIFPHEDFKLGEHALHINQSFLPSDWVVASRRFVSRRLLRCRLGLDVVQTGDQQNGECSDPGALGR